MGEEAEHSTEAFDSTVEAKHLTEEVKSFINQELLDNKHNERKDFIEQVLRQMYTNEEVQIEPFQTFKVAEAAVWVDPLDATNAFVRGELDYVSLLIGLSIKGISKAAVLHKPFVNKTLFGTAEHGVY